MNRSFAATLECVRSSVGAARAANDPDALRQTLRREGELLLLDGQPNAALLAFLEAVKLGPGTQLTEQARLWQQAAHAQATLFSPIEAQEHLGVALNLMAQVRLGQARLVAAQGVGAQTQPTQTQLAQLQSAQLQSAQELARQALSLSRRSASPYTEVPALQLLSTLAEAAGDLRAALDYHHAYHDLSVTLGRAQSLVRAQEVSARLDLESSRQETELQRARGSRLERRVAERTAQLELAQSEMTLLLASAAECRDAPQGLHNAWVGEASACVARRLGWEEAQARDLGLAARLHDIGKLAIPDAVLLKKGALDEAEWTLVQTHTTLGARLLARSTSPLLKLAAEVALSHHERWDGSGYPAGALGAQAPQAGRIVAVVDAFDALLSTRSYKAAWSVPDAAAYLQEHAGTLFDAEVVQALVWLSDHAGLPPRR